MEGVKSFQVGATWRWCVWHNYQDKCLGRAGLELWQRLNRMQTSEEMGTLRTEA